jgi:hypothetical protein
MHSVDETPEVRNDWRTILRDQGRTMTWLAKETGKSYPTVVNYSRGTVKTPPEWLDKVGELLGEPVR